MKVIRLDVMVVDFDGMGIEAVKEEIENMRHTSGVVLSAKEREISDWHDDHPLNCRDTAKAEIERLFSEPYYWVNP